MKGFSMKLTHTLNCEWKFVWLKDHYLFYYGNYELIILKRERKMVYICVRVQNRWKLTIFFESESKIMIWIKWKSKLDKDDKLRSLHVWFESWFESCDSRQANTWFESHIQNWIWIICIHAWFKSTIMMIRVKMPLIRGKKNLFSNKIS